MQDEKGDEVSVVRYEKNGDEEEEEEGKEREHTVRRRSRRWRIKGIRCFCLSFVSGLVRSVGTEGDGEGGGGSGG